MQHILRARYAHARWRLNRKYSCIVKARSMDFHSAHGYYIQFLLDYVLKDSFYNSYLENLWLLKWYKKCYERKYNNILFEI